MPQIITVSSCVTEKVKETLRLLLSRGALVLWEAVLFSWALLKFWAHAIGQSIMSCRRYVW